MSKFVRPDDGPMMADVLGDDRFSPGVSCCVVLDQPVGKLLLESVLIAHTSDILVDKSDTIMDCSRSDLYLPLGHIFGYKKMWRLSVFDSDSPDFPDNFCFGMPRLPNGIGNMDLDVDTALLARGAVPGL